MSNDSTLRPVSLLHVPDAAGTSPAYFTRTLGLGFEERYQQLGLLGLGSMGEVFRVHDTAFGRDLAMKTARRALEDPLRLSRFHREAVVTAQLAHPAILPVFDVGLTPDGVPFYTMPIVEGQTLSSLLVDPPPLGVRVGIVVRVLEALVHAHARGVIHRDIKPSNVMIGAYGEVYVTDWGLVKLVDPTLEGAAPGPKVSGPQTRLGSVAGTPSYMSPEQAIGLTLDRPTDVYSAGAVLYEVLTGTPPFRGADALDVLEKVRSKHVESPVERVGHPLPEPLVELCLAMMARSRNSRPAAEVALRTLTAWLDGRKRSANAEAQIQKGKRAFAQARTLRAEGERREAEGHDKVEAGDRSAWDDVDQGRELKTEASHLFEQARDAFQSAVSEVPESVDGHACLVELHQTVHAIARAEGRSTLSQRAEAAVATHARALGSIDADLARWIEGQGEVDLPLKRTHQVRVARLDTDGGRIEAVPLDTPEQWPASLPAGWIQVDVQKSGSASCRLVFEVERAARIHPLEGRKLHWVRDRALGPDDIFIPGGRGRSGWVEPYILRRFPVTLAEYAAFLEATDRRVPSACRTHPRHPVRGLSKRDLRDFLAWIRKDTRQRWRLCSVAEWELAASPDGRRHPWGDRLRRDWCGIDRDGATDVDAYPMDVGAFGVRAQGACVYEMCSDAWPGDADARVVKGASWATSPDAADVSIRRRSDGVPPDQVGFRLARSLRT